jgi:CubicO group peptidase (beta-lactamase class C family)
MTQPAGHAPRRPAGRRRVLVATGALVGAVLLGAAAFTGHRIVGIGTAFFAKQLCSGVFVSGRAPHDVVRNDLHAYPPAIVLTNIAWDVDAAAGHVRAAWFGLAPRVAIHRRGTGCALLEAGGAHAGTPAPAIDSPSGPVAHDAEALWPDGDRVTLPDRIRGAPRDRLDAAIDTAFVPPRGTRAVVVVADGRIVAERYAAGFTADMRLPGWSMAKSVTHALVGVLVEAGRLRPDEPLALAAWSGAGDARAAITFRHALGMVTGLDFDERYANPLADVTRMLFESHDAAAFAAARPLGASPGTRWAYTSGTTNLVSRALRERLGDAAYRTFPQRALFARIGMRSPVFETDASGTFVASSFLLATARDWARFGLLYVADGVWAGERVLPADWVKQARTPVPESDGRYGAHFWIGAGDTRHAADASAAPVAPDAFHAAGHAGQFVTIVPSRGLVVVRLGHSVGTTPWDQTGLVRAVADALEAR